MIEFTLKQLFLFYFMYWFIISFSYETNKQVFFWFGCPTPWECSPELCFLHVIWAFVIACTCIVVLEMYFYNFLGIRSGLCPYFSLLSKDAMCHVNLIFVNTEKLKKEKCTMRQLTKSNQKSWSLVPSTQNYKRTTQLKQWDKWYPHCRGQSSYNFHEPRDLIVLSWFLFFSTLSPPLINDERY